MKVADTGDNTYTLGLKFGLLYKVILKVVTDLSIKRLHNLVCGLLQENYNKKLFLIVIYNRFKLPIKNKIIQFLILILQENICRKSSSFITSIDRGYIIILFMVLLILLNDFFKKILHIYKTLSAK